MAVIGCPLIGMSGHQFTAWTTRLGRSENHALGFQSLASAVQ